MTRRRATHAYEGWYRYEEDVLSEQLDNWLSKVPAKVQCIGTDSSKSDSVDIPPQGARLIIAPHAGYDYSGPAAAWAYKALDLSKAKRVFLLGPSHKYILRGCALSQCDVYETPLGDLRIDKETVAELHKTKAFDKMSKSQDENEHSLEMHLPYIYKVLSRAFPDESKFPPLIPILVGATSTQTERRYGNILAPYLRDPSSVFVVSSDFAHWGLRFSYTYYQPASGSPIELQSSRRPSNPPIHKSIAQVDMYCMDAIETGSYENFWDAVEETRNTICGRHPIGVIMAAIEHVKEQDGLDYGKGKFKFVRYERSSLCESVRDSSVSYCSAFAIL